MPYAGDQVGSDAREPPCDPAEHTHLPDMAVRQVPPERSARVLLHLSRQHDRTIGLSHSGCEDERPGRHLGANRAQCRQRLGQRVRDKRVSMKNAVVRIASVVSATLVVGALVFAAAEADQSPSASQIPTVVTGSSTAASQPAPSASGSTSPAPKPSSTEPGTHASRHRTHPASGSTGNSAGSSGSSGSDSSGDSHRDVVTPVVRNDGDRESDSTKHTDGDSHDSGSSTSGGGTEHHKD
jgi:hypothetical protein